MTENEKKNTSTLIESCARPISLPVAKSYVSERYNSIDAEIRFSLPEIGRRFGGRDHSTVLHAVRKIEEQIKTDDRLAREVALLIRLVEQG